MNNRTFLIEKGETMGVCFTVSFHIDEPAADVFDIRVSSTLHLAIAEQKKRKRSQGTASALLSGT
jgi:hypothetical protein